MYSNAPDIASDFDADALKTIYAKMTSLATLYSQALIIP